MSELQNDDGAVETNEPVVENLDTGSELAPDSDGQHEVKDQVDEDAKRQQAFEKKLGEQTFKAKQAERDLQAANDKLSAIAQADMEKKEAAVSEIPPLPDRYDDDFDSKMADRDAAILAQADFNSTKAASEREQQFQQQQAQQLQQEQVQKSAVSYNARATELGINQAELQAAGTAVGQYGLSDDLAMHILSDPDGPLITKHLAANPQEGFELASMSPYAVGTYLDGIRAKAETLKPKTSSAPAPADTLAGNGADPDTGKYRNIKGTVYS